MLCIRPGEHGSTYGGNPLGCAVAITALDVIRSENLCERSTKLGELFRAKLREFASSKEAREAGGLVKEVRGEGIVQCGCVG